MPKTPEELRAQALDLLEASVPWVERLSPTHFHAFMTAFASAMGEAMERGELGVVSTQLEAWQRTAEADERWAFRMLGTMSSHAAQEER